MRTRFITSAPHPTDFPETDLPEVAIIGRSNVGKSSLLNALTRSKIARTSRTPGRTQLVNFFELYTGEKTYVLADLPGHGYARAPNAVRVEWSKLIKSYLELRVPLKMVLLLLDARRGAEGDDLLLHRALIDSLGPRRIGVEVVATKVDKLSKAEIKPAIGAITGALGLPKEAVLPTSASKGIGLDALRARIEARMH
jgi:GTP-binding protein